MLRTGDVMTTKVISVAPDDSVLHAVRLMLQHKISGLPVIDAHGALVGIVTEGDLLRRAETGTQKQHPRWIEFMIGPGVLAEEYVRASARKISEIMSRNVRAIDEDTPVSEAVDLMEERRIKRLPVVRDGKVVGILSRANLLHALASVGHEAEAATPDDVEIRETLLRHLDKQPWAPLAIVNVTVRDGVVELWGAVTDERERTALVIAAENIPGVKSVRDHLAWIDPLTGMVVTNDAEPAKA